MKAELTTLSEMLEVWGREKMQWRPRFLKGKGWRGRKKKDEQSEHR